MGWKSAAAAYWPRVLWAAGILNVLAELPQTWRLVVTRHAEGVSLTMFWVYLVLQILFAYDGHLKHHPVFTWCLGAAALVTAANIFLICTIRS